MNPDEMSLEDKVKENRYNVQGPAYVDGPQSLEKVLVQMPYPKCQAFLPSLPNNLANINLDELFEGDDEPGSKNLWS